MVEIIIEAADRTSKASTIVFNTYNELESDVNENSQFYVPFCIHHWPFTFFFESSLGSNLGKEDTMCLDWLESKEPESIVYVMAFGYLRIGSGFPAPTHTRMNLYYI
jgi:hypothetical protein